MFNMQIGLPQRKTPEWLKKLEDVFCAIDPEKVLADSVFSPVTLEYTDIIRLLGSTFYTFSFSVSGLVPCACRLTANNIWLRGVRQVSSRNLIIDELVPAQPVRQVVVQKKITTGFAGWLKAMKTKSSGSSMMTSDQGINHNISEWFLCDDGTSTRDGRAKHSYSIMRLGGEADVVYQHLYWMPEKVPALVSLIEPRCENVCLNGKLHGWPLGNTTISVEDLQIAMTGAWEKTLSPAGLFHGTVMDNPAGIPEFLLVGGAGSQMDYNTPCWPQYDQPVCFWSESGMSYSLWRKQAGEKQTGEAG